MVGRGTYRPNNDFKSMLRKLTLTFALTLLPVFLFAGSMDDAPFRLVLPVKEWQLDDNARFMGKDVAIVATVTHTNSGIRSVVVKTALRKVTPTALEDMSLGIRDSLENPAVKKISETNTNFLGYKAKLFVYEATQSGRTTYNETTIFVAGKLGWSIACVGPVNQKANIKRVIGFYQKK